MARNEVRTAARQRSRRRQWAIVIGIVVLVAAATAAVFASRGSTEAPGARIADQGNRHTPTVSSPHEPYNSDPPTSGAHVGYIAPWGIHTRPIPPELQVHNLEDGGVLVQYNCECPEVAARLAEIVRRYDRFVILAPYPTMKHRVAVTAWTRIDTMEEVDAKRITRFIEAHRGVDHHPGR